MTPKQYIEKLEKGCGCEYEEWSYDKDGIPMSSEDKDCSNFFGLCPECKKKLESVKEVLKMCNRLHDDFVKKLIKRIKINGNLSGRIIETEDGEFKNKHDSVLNNIVIEVIEEELTELKKEMFK